MKEIREACDAEYDIIADEIDAATFHNVQYREPSDINIVFYSESSDAPFYVVIDGFGNNTEQCTVYFKVQDRISKIVYKIIDQYIKKYYPSEKFKSQVIKETLAFNDIKGNKKFHEAIEGITLRAREITLREETQAESKKQLIEYSRNRFKSEFNQAMRYYRDAELNENDVLKLIKEFEIKEIHEE